MKKETSSTTTKKEVVIQFKTVTLGKSRINWRSPTVSLPNPNATTDAEIIEHRRTSSFKLPTDTKFIQSLFIDGAPVYDLAHDDKPRATSAIGGGGRYYITRSLVDGVVVACTLILKDYTGDKVSVVVGHEKLVEVK